MALKTEAAVEGQYCARDRKLWHVSLDVVRSRPHVAGPQKSRRATQAGAIWRNRQSTCRRASETVHYCVDEGIGNDYFLRSNCLNLSSK